MRSGFRAWITTDRNIVDGDQYEIKVYAFDGDENFVGDAFFSGHGTITITPPFDEDTADLVRDAESVLRNAGWVRDGELIDYESGYYWDVVSGR